MFGVNLPTEVIVSLISSVIGVLLVAVVSYVLTRRKTHAETEKLIAETEKIKAEAEKVKTETREDTEAKIAELLAEFGNNDRLDETQSNLPTQNFFFGRKKELESIADALTPESRGWGVLIDGPGGIGKTALAIQAGHLAFVTQFPRKIFLSAKRHELTSSGKQPLDDFMLTTYMALLVELGRELGDETISKKEPSQRPKLVNKLLSNERALLIIDNVESFEPEERIRLYQFLNYLPSFCKAIVTSRRRTDIDARVIRLGRLDRGAALTMIKKLAENNSRLRRTSDQEREMLYELTNGNPLLIRWIAGQLEREGSQCRTIAEAWQFMKEAPAGNDPLEYIFGDIVGTLTESEMAVLAALVHFFHPAKVEWIAELANLSEPVAQTALEDLSDRALLEPDEEEKLFFLPRSTMTFLLKKQRQQVAQSGNRLINWAYNLIMENGWMNFDRYPTLEAQWPAVVAALQLFVQVDVALFQGVCSALNNFLDYTGRLDEKLILNLEAEEKAVAANDFHQAGWRAYSMGNVFRARGQPEKVLECAVRAGSHWEKAQVGLREQAMVIQLRGWGYELKKDYSAAITAYKEMSELDRLRLPEGIEDLVVDLVDLSHVELLSDDYDAAEEHILEALQIAKKSNDKRGVENCIRVQAKLALAREEWATAEKLANEALPLINEQGNLESLGEIYHTMAKALIKQDRPEEGLHYIKYAVAILKHLGAPALAGAMETLQEYLQE